jgi:hypothetical protein
MQSLKEMIVLLNGNGITFMICAINFQRFGSHINLNLLY